MLAFTQYNVKSLLLTTAADSVVVGEFSGGQVVIVNSPSVHRR